MFERFSARGRRVLVLARDEAERFNDNLIGTEHILLGLISEGGGLAAQALESLGVSEDAVREIVRDAVRPGRSTTTSLQAFSARTKRVLELSLREALKVGYSYIQTEHILLGLLSEGEGAAADVLVKLAGDLSSVRERVIELISGSAPGETSLAGQPTVLGGDIARDDIEVDETAFGRRLVDRGLITEDQLLAVGERRPDSPARLGALLVDSGAIDEYSLVEVLGEYLDLPVADLRLLRPEPLALGLLPETTARQRMALPLRIREGEIEIAVSEPTLALRRLLADVTGCRVCLFVAPASDLRRAIDTHCRALGSVSELAQAFEAVEGRPHQPGEVADVLTSAGDAPVIRLCHMIMTQGLGDRASYVHIEPQDGFVRVRFRVDGALYDAVTLPIAIGPGVVSRFKILAGMNIVERRRPQEGRFTVEIGGRSVDVRVATAATIWGEECVLRLLDKTRSLLKLNDLGMAAETHQRFSTMFRAPFGMVLCAGPIRSGKTTTLYATLSEIDESYRKIMTIEDPIETILPGISQIQTNEQAGLSFATGLRSILRQDPDVILVGEIRDVETARIAVQSALSGHFVLASLDTTDSISALHRLLDMGIEPFLLSSSVIGIVSQRLVRRICPSCKAPHQPTAEELAFYEQSGGPPKTTFYHGEGCNICAGTGYRDRIGIFELLGISPELKRLIVGSATQDELRRLARQEGMGTLQEEAVALIAKDVTTIAEVVHNLYAL